MGSSTTPNFESWIAQCWGYPGEGGGGYLGAFSNIVVGTNPPYYAGDFLSMYPKFGGTPTAVAVSVTGGTSTVTSSGEGPGNFTSNGAQVGQLLLCGGYLPNNTAIQAINSATSVTVTTTALQNGTNVTASLYTAPFVPMVALNAFIALASASLVQARWQDSWTLAMGWYIAHYATLYLRSDGDIYCDAGEAAAAGLKAGITVSASAGPSSQSMELPSGLDDWSAWKMTTYGVQLATLAKVVGSGPAMFY